MQTSKYISSAILVLALSGVPASASLSVYIGEDLGAGPGAPAPSSNAAAASFDTAAATLGNVGIITFESASLGSYSSLTVAPGVSINGKTVNGTDQSILNAPYLPSLPDLAGFNTTPGGSQYANMDGGALTFTFATPTQFFGAYLSGVQTNFYQDVLQFSDGTSETVNVPGLGTTSSAGALDFVGFTDPGKSITGITIIAGPVASGGFDEIGVDDVRYQTAATPEPGYGALMLIGFFGMVLVCRQYRVGRE